MSVRRSAIESPLIPKKSLRYKPVTIRLPEDILERMQQMKEDANALGYVFDTQTILISALQTALDYAEKELEQKLK